MNDNLPTDDSPQEPSPQGGIRKLAAIMFTDIKDFSKKMQKNETATMRMLDTHNSMMRESVERYNGNVIKTVGDAFLVSFESVSGATQCAIEAQQRFHEYNKDKSSDEKITVRIGVHLGDVIIKDKDVFGDGVNIASRIQSMAEPGGVNISGSVYEQVKNKLDIHVINLGVPQLKNIKEMIKVYQVIIVPTDKARGKFSTQIYVGKTILKRKRSQRILAVGVIGIVALSLVWKYILAPPPPPAGNSIAVLPFVNMSDSTDEYFADGLTEDVITHLTQIPQLKVISKGSSFFYKNSKLQEKEIGENLGVHYLLAGTVRVLSDNIHVNVRLIDTKNDADVWASPYDNPREELHTIQDRIAREVAQRLRLRIAIANDTSKISPEVNDLFYRGLFYAKLFKKDDNVLAISYFKQALEKDSNFIPARLRLARAELINFEKKWDLNETWVLDAEQNAQRVLSSDSVSTEAFEILGRVEILRGNHKKGLELLERSIKIDPNNVSSLTELGQENAFNLDDPAKAVTYFSRAVELEPTEFSHANMLGVGYAMLRNYRQSIQAFRRSAILNPDHESPWINLGYSFERLAVYDSAIFYYGIALQKNPTNVETYQNISDLLFVTGKIALAESLLTQAIKYDPGNYRLLYLLGISKSYSKHSQEAYRVWTEGLKIVDNMIVKESGIPELHIYSGLFHARMGASSEAVKEGIAAYRIDSLNNECVLGVARIFSLVGKRDSVFVWFVRARALNPEYDAAYLSTAVDFENFRNDSQLISLLQK